MFGWAFTLALAALVLAILGFGGIAGTLADIAIFLFVVALVGAAILAFLGWKAGRAILR